MSEFVVTMNIDGSIVRTRLMASSPSEAGKMSELSARWKNLDANVKIVEVKAIEVCGLKPSPRTSK